MRISATLAFGVTVVLGGALGLLLSDWLKGEPETNVERIGQRVTREFSSHVRVDCGHTERSDAYCFAVPQPPLQVASVLESFDWQRAFGATPTGSSWEEAPGGGLLPFRLDGRDFVVVVTGSAHDTNAGVILALSRE